MGILVQHEKYGTFCEDRLRLMQYCYEHDRTATTAFSELPANFCVDKYVTSIDKCLLIVMRLTNLHYRY